MIVIKTFLNRKILSVKTFLNAYTHTRTHTHKQAPAHTSILTI